MQYHSILTRWNFTAEAAVLALDNIHEAAVVHIHVGAGRNAGVDDARRPITGVVGIHRCELCARRVFLRVTCCVCVFVFFTEFTRFCCSFYD